jgi:hypothetical protein
VPYLKVVQAAGALTFVLVAHSASAATGARQDCLTELIYGRKDVISCTFPTRMTQQELESIQKTTRGLLTDASCAMEVSVARKAVDDAVATADHVFQAPPQPVTCEVLTTKGNFPVAFTFAPRVEFKAGQAVKASPGMASVTRVSAVLAWPVVTWVNRAGLIEKGMLDVVNAYLRRYGPRATASR